jgi:uncharacterized membrane protein YgdD (TMEM256/DUF423 family)
VVNPASAGARTLAALGAIYCASAVALGAYAAHAAPAAARDRIDTAVLFLFLHGLALVALLPQLHGPLRLALAAALAAGTALFAGSVAAAALFGLPSMLAPVGGMLLIGGWAGMAVALLQKRN